MSQLIKITKYDNGYSVESEGFSRIYQNYSDVLTALGFLLETSPQVNIEPQELIDDYLSSNPDMSMDLDFLDDSSVDPQLEKTVQSLFTRISEPEETESDV